MSLYKNWEQSIEKAAPGTAQELLESYYDKETLAYQKILAAKRQVVTGKASDLAVELGLTTDEFGAFACLMRSISKDLCFCEK